MKYTRDEAIDQVISDLSWHPHERHTLEAWGKMIARDLKTEQDRRAGILPVPEPGPVTDCMHRAPGGVNYEETEYDALCAEIRSSNPGFCDQQVSEAADDFIGSQRNNEWIAEFNGFTS